MKIRDASPEDSFQIEKIHSDMGMDYRLPELEHPLFIVRKVADKDGAVVGACFLRITAETYLWLDPALHPREKLQVMENLQPAVLSEAYEKGLDDIEARIPAAVEKKFYKRLIQLGWERARDGWRAWSRSTNAGRPSSSG